MLRPGGAPGAPRVTISGQRTSEAHGHAAATYAVRRSSPVAAGGGIEIATLLT